MIFWVRRLVQTVLKRRQAGLAMVPLLVALALTGNTLTYYWFDGATNPEISLGDALWYSLVSITTIGYGDFYAQSTGARIGLVVFIGGVGLAAFSAFLGLLVNWIVELNYKEIRGMGEVTSKGHILIINFPSAARVRQMISEIRADPALAKADIVIISDELEQLPFQLERVSFISGSPLQQETLERAGLPQARIAVVLCTRADDPRSDSVVASTIAVIEHLNPHVKTVAECLDARHRLLFESTNCDSVILSDRIVGNLLVQELHDSGVHQLIATITSNRVGDNLSTTRMDEALPSIASYTELAKTLLDRQVNLMAVVRDGTAVTDLGRLDPRVGDLLLYVARQRLSWPELRALVSA